MIDIVKNKCNGCGLCVEICPKEAIHMNIDQEGFLRPRIDASICVKCDICENHCPALMSINNDTYKKVYAVKNNDEVRKYSASGGFFSAISDYILRNEGAIYGAVYNSVWQVIHVKAVDSETRGKMRGSKYVQSDILKCYKDILQDVKNGEWILFTGTPCQCAAVTEYLKIQKAPIDKVIVCDILCEGVTSPRIWEDYLRFICKKNLAVIKNINFRSKIEGWKKIYIYIEKEDGDYRGSFDEDVYYQLFSRHYIMRPSCHVCNFAHVNRNTDFTMGDFWAYQRLPETFDDDKGISMVLVNSEKGKLIWDTIRDDFEYLESTIDIAKEKQKPLKTPTMYNPDRKRLWACYLHKGFLKTISRYTTYGRAVRIERKIKKTIKNAVFKLTRNHDA